MEAFTWLKGKETFKAEHYNRIIISSVSWKVFHTPWLEGWQPQPETLEVNQDYRQCMTGIFREPGPAETKINMLTSRWDGNKSSMDLFVLITQCAMSWLSHALIGQAQIRVQLQAGDVQGEARAVVRLLRELQLRSFPYQWENHRFSENRFAVVGRLFIWVNTFPQPLIIHFVTGVQSKVFTNLRAALQWAAISLSMGSVPRRRQSSLEAKTARQKSQCMRSNRINSACIFWQFWVIVLKDIWQLRWVIANPAHGPA